MPTGYTSIIDEHPKMKTKQWIMEGLARAFGVAVTLREESMDLTEEQIRQRIEDDHSVSWNEKELEEAKQEATKLKTRTEKEWYNAYMESEKTKEKQNKRSINKAKRMKKRHDQVLHDLRLIANSDVSEFTKSVVKFGMEQLKIVEHETEPYTQKPVTLHHFKFESEENNKRNIAYHTEELAEAKQRVKERLEAYSQLRKDLDKILGE